MRSGLKSILVAILAICCLPTWAGTNKPYIVFINPGLHDESFWVTYAGLMQAAAKQLGWTLDVRYAERDHVRMVALARQALQVSPKPDYLLLVNEKPVMSPILQAANRAGVDTLLLSNGLNEQEQAFAGHPRERFKHWLGTIVPDNQQAGYLLAQSVLAQATTGPATLVALRGVRSTQADVDRYQGLQRYLAEHGNVILAYELEANWRRIDANQQIERLLGFKRPINAIWAANDEMALGAMDALANTKMARLPVGGVLSSTRGVEALAAGKLRAMPGGHVALGACALMLLNDYRQGHDFANGKQAEITIPIFELVDRNHAASWLQLYEPTQWASLPFKRWPTWKAGTPRCPASELLNH
ncbi:ABC transporter substrate-binding protein [Andreprevotia chitinilytica]|uniref:ABC transporter substrate-binding protein n=1 Tax=Andreprevotia chitinilytica TaxID=396808 RepID=UPI00068A3A60|nr:ABC transporter substrate-binding protein [Andreprevotia chitinilytica]